MFATVLLAVDGSGHANRAIECAADMAKRYGARLVVLTARVPGPLPDEVEGFALAEDLSAAEIGERILDAAVSRARSHGVADVVPVIGNGDPARLILATAKEHQADLIVLGSRGVGAIAGLVLGSVSHKVLHLSDRPCLVVP